MCAYGAHLCIRCVTSFSRILFCVRLHCHQQHKIYQYVQAWKRFDSYFDVARVEFDSNTRVLLWMQHSGNPYAAAVTAVGVRMKYFSNSDVRFDVIWMHFACKRAITEDTISRELANRFDKCVRIKNAPIRYECNLINCTLCHRAPYIRASNEDFFSHCQNIVQWFCRFHQIIFLCFRLIEDIN